MTQKLSKVAATLALMMLAPMAMAQTPIPADATTSTPAPADTASPDSPQPETTEPNTTKSPADTPTPKPAKPRARFMAGPEAGVYFPSVSKTQRTFGKQWIDLGFGLGRLDALPSKGEVSLSLESAYKKQGKNEVILAPLGIEFKQALMPEHAGGGSVRPYIGVTAGICASYFKAAAEGIRAGVRGTPCGTVFLGLQANRTAFFEARYLKMGKVRGYDFSGFAINAGARF